MLLVEKYFISIFFTTIIIGTAFNQRIAGPLTLFFAATALFYDYFATSNRNTSLFRNIRPSRENYWLLLALVFSFWSFASLMWGVGGIEVYDKPIKQISYLLSAVILFNYVARHPQEFQPETGVILLIIFAYLVDQHFFGLLENLRKSINLPNFYNRINVSIVLFAICIAGIIINQYKNNKRTLFLLACLAISTGYFSLNSYSQTSMLAWVIGWSTLIVCYFSGRIVCSIILAALGLAPLIVVSGVYFGNDLLFNLVSLDTALVQESFSGIRLGIWQETIRLALNHIFIGSGNNALYTISSVYPLKSELFPGQLLVANHPHNAFLQIWLEFGLVGLSLVTMVLLAISLSISRIRGPVMAPVIALYAAIISVSSVSHGAWQSWWMGTLVLLVTMTIAFTIKRKT